MGKGVARANVDFSSTHTKDSTHTALAETKYIAGIGANVFINGNPVICLSDKTACGDTVEEASSKVFVNGKGVHRLGDKMNSHNHTYSPSFCASASDNVFCG